jgi:hypothetical protein
LPEAGFVNEQRSSRDECLAWSQASGNFDEAALLVAGLH